MSFLHWDANPPMDVLQVAYVQAFGSLCNAAGAFLLGQVRLSRSLALNEKSSSSVHRHQRQQVCLCRISCTHGSLLRRNESRA